jgi:hypothetical protein
VEWVALMKMRTENTRSAKETMLIVKNQEVHFVFCVANKNNCFTNLH